MLLVQHTDSRHAIIDLLPINWSFWRLYLWVPRVTTIHWEWRTGLLHRRVRLAHSNVVQGPPNPPTQNYSFSNCQVNIYNNSTATPHHQQDVHVAALRDVTNRPS